VAPTSKPNSSADQTTTCSAPNSSANMATAHIAPTNQSAIASELGMPLMSHCLSKCERLDLPHFCLGALQSEGGTCAARNASALVGNRIGHGEHAAHEVGICHRLAFRVVSFNRWLGRGGVGRGASQGQHQNQRAMLDAKAAGLDRACRLVGHRELRVASGIGSFHRPDRRPSAPIPSMAKNYSIRLPLRLSDVPRNARHDARLRPCSSQQRINFLPSALARERPLAA
jgi:hypothetical protein